MYYNIAINTKTKKLEFHSGYDREEVGNCESLNHAVSLEPEHLDLAFRSLNEWKCEIELYSLTIA